MGRFERYLEKIEKVVQEWWEKSVGLKILAHMGYQNGGFLTILGFNISEGLEEIMEVPYVIWSAEIYNNELYIGTRKEGIYKYGIYEFPRVIYGWDYIDQLFVYKNRLYALVSSSNGICIINRDGARLVRNFHLPKIEYVIWIFFDSSGTPYIHYTTKEKKFIIARLNDLFSSEKIEEIYSGVCRNPLRISQTEFLFDKYAITAGSDESLDIIDFEKGRKVKTVYSGEDIGRFAIKRILQDFALVIAGDDGKRIMIFLGIRKTPEGGFQIETKTYPYHDLLEGKSIMYFRPLKILSRDEFEFVKKNVFGGEQK